VVDTVLPRGQALYARICAVCHGLDGQGYKADRAPALGHPDFLATVSNDLLRDAIANGRHGTTMSAWSHVHGGPLDDKEIDAVIAYIRSWATRPNQPKVTLDERGPQGGDAQRGGALFTKHCESCHGAGGIGGQYTRIGDPALLAHASNGFLRHAIEKGRAPTPMAGFKDTLGGAAVEDLLAYLRSLQQAAKLAAMAPELPRPLPLGPVPLHPRGPEPKGFVVHPGVTPLNVVFREYMRGARMAVLDARAPSDYVQDHIAGAVSVPFYDPTPFLPKLPKDTWMVSYCACPHAESQTLAQKLLDAGFKKVTVLDEGIGAWKGAGHPTHGGEQP